MQQCKWHINLDSVLLKKYTPSHVIVFAFLPFIFLNILGCSDSGDKKLLKTPNPNQMYQVGLSWNREPLTPVLHYPYQVLNMNRTHYGDVGLGVYLGQINGKAIGMTVAHLYPYLESCVDDVSFLIQDQGSYHYYPCAGWSIKLIENDIMLFEIDTSRADINLLVPVTISKKSLSKNQQLKLITFERNLVEDTVVLNTDSSFECRNLSNQIKHIADPDMSDERKITSWSVATGCDSKHGDSGAPIYDEESSLVGLLWTGKYPKDQISQNLKMVSDKQIWEEYNYFVPVEKIKKELNQFTLDSKISASDQEVLTKVLELF